MIIEDAAESARQQEVKREDVLLESSPQRRFSTILTFLLNFIN
jgi:hypothetical protein